MRMKATPLALATALALSCPSAFAADLMQSYTQARQSDPTLSISESQNSIAKENVVQSRANLLPQLSGTVSVNRNENGGTLNNGATDPLAPIAPGATTAGIVGVINAGLINPFSLTQTDAGLAALRAVSAEGTTLFGGKYEVKQVDASVSGPLFSMPAGDVQIAAGIDYRRETYSFNGSPAAVAGQPVIFLAAFDNVNALTPKNRDVKAAYAEHLLTVPAADNVIRLLPALNIPDADISEALARLDRAAARVKADAAA